MRSLTSTDSLVPSPEALEQRRREAIATAQQCVEILQQEFGATSVIVFGSLRGDAPWHWHSDLDLAVEGLSDRQIWDAWSRLEQVTPGWLQFDLLALETTKEPLRSRILQTQPMPKNRFLALKVRIEDELIALNRNCAKLSELIDQAETIPQIALTPALAGYIADVYTGCERICERVAVTLDGGLPNVKDWHEQLLVQVAAPGGSVDLSVRSTDRPAFLSPELFTLLNDYRKFRHVVRHRYNDELIPERVMAIAQGVTGLMVEMEGAIAQFNQWLEAVAATAQ